MDQQALLAAFDEQIRQRPHADGPRARVEREGAVVRVIDPDGGWAGVTWSDLDAASADAAIAAQVARFAQLPGAWEWKHYSYDRPGDLAERLGAAGFEPEPVEALLVAEIADLALDVQPPDGVRLEPVVDAAGVEALVRVHDQVFGGDHVRAARALLRGLTEAPDTVAAVLAVAGDEPVAASRMELHQGTDFASLWGGGTLPNWRRRGIFHAMVAYRARLASARGFRYLQVDASPDSRPILRRLGFAELAMTTPFLHPG